MARLADILNPFRFGKQRKEQKGPAPQFLKRVTPRETTSGQIVFPTLEERIKGLNVGIPERVLSEAEGPIAAPFRRGAARARESSAAALSAAGLGRSTLRGAQAGDITLRAEETIADKIARLRIANEQLKRSEISDAIARLQQAAGAEAGAANAEKAQNVTEFNRQQRIRDENVEEANKDLAKFQGLIGAAATAAIPGGQFAAAGMLADVFGSGEGGGFSKEDISLIEEILNGKLGTTKQIAS